MRTRLGEAPAPAPTSPEGLAPWVVHRDSTRRVLVATAEVGPGARLLVEADTADALRSVVAGLRGQSLVVP
jgi:hypothetical protein